MARVVVIGGGFGGLASALRLAKLGHTVTIVEERDLGGALIPVAVDGFSWDVATHTLLPAVVRDLFRKTGRPLEKELELTQLDCLREHWFEDGSSVVLTAGRSAQHDALEQLQAGLGGPWLEHVGSYADDWDVVRRGYAETPWDPAHVPTDLAARLDSRETLHKRLRRSLRDPRLRLLASHPFEIDGHDIHEVPAWAGLTAYLEQRFGAWAFVGGTAALLQALQRRLATRRVEVVRARALDIELRDDAPTAVRTSSGELAADVVVCAIDPRRLPALARAVRATMPAIPASMTLVGLEGEIAVQDQLVDLPHELVIHGDPTVVVRTLGRAPRGRHAWTIQTRGNRDDDPLTVLARHGLDVRDHVVTRLDLSPRDLVERWGGSPLGVVWQGRSTVRRRLGPGTPVPGVYAAGAHAAPGTGLHYVGLSAALVAQSVGSAQPGRLRPGA
jgi:phytoene dehydrogenase-like protein